MKISNWFIGLSMMIVLLATSVSVLAVGGVMLPPPHITGPDDDAIMDVDDNAASFTGTWTSSTAKILYYGDDYEWAQGSGSSTVTREATWTTARTADITGRYQIYVRWTTDPNREETARYRVYNGVADTSANCSCNMNQTVNGGAWRYCCSTTLTKGQKGVVKLGNENTDTNEVVIADGVRFVRVSVDDGDIVDEPGVEWANRGDQQINTITNSCRGGADWTKLSSFSLTAPTSGFVIVNASGIAKLTAGDRWVRLCISDAATGAGCESLSPFLENNSDEANKYYEDEVRYALNEVYSVSAGSRTYYLKACRESGATGTVWWNDFYGLFVPTKY